ncbi:MAG TPA: hypothetical protein VMW27_03240 [Thermoanaerobaculia bacterium]|nr:hypothetical protein [Thermoanaerobaculia bacterium]
MRRHHHFASALLIAVLAAPLAAQAPDPLAPVASFAGGTWIGEGKWPDGSPLRVEQRFFWGPTRRVLHFESYDLTGKERKLLYEGLLFFDPKRGRVVQMNFKPAGGVDEIEITDVNEKGYEVKGNNTWSIIRHNGPDEFLWELRIPDAQGWKTILNATYRRQK